MRNESGTSSTNPSSSAFAGLTVAHDVLTSQLEHVQLDDDALPADAAACFPEETCLAMVG